MREIGQESSTHALSPEFRPHEQILEIQTALREKSGIIVKEEGKARGFSLDFSKNDLGPGLRAKERSAQAFFAGDDFVGEAFIFRQIADKLQNEREVSFCGRANENVRHRKYSFFICVRLRYLRTENLRASLTKSLQGSVDRADQVSS